VEVLLVTDRKGTALVFPKGGCNDRDRSAKCTAAREALEEAGVRGKLRRLNVMPKYTSKRKGIKVKGNKVSLFL
jgi:8-oxo-dGTP pyrophosphatase MutT (NUDIX family)